MRHPNPWLQGGVAISQGECEKDVPRRAQAGVRLLKQWDEQGRGGASQARNGGNSVPAGGSSLLGRWEVWQIPVLPSCVCSPSLQLGMMFRSSFPAGSKPVSTSPRNLVGLWARKGLG